MSIIKREILYPGKTDFGILEPEAKLFYHFQTTIIQSNGSESKVVDESRQMTKGSPVETIYGKQFKLPIWESCLSSMRKGEICRLTVRDDPITHYICLNYVATSKCFRKHYGVQPTHREHEGHMTSHNCSLSIRNSPYKDLNNMIQRPPEIFEFTFELVDVKPPESYTKDLWQMSDAEKLNILPKFREDGNRYYVERNYDGAISSYTKGLNVIESLMIKERPKDDDWNRLDDMKNPFLLNLAQVKLTQCEYYECIKYADKVLEKNPDNIKALFRRAKAHAGAWNLNEAKEDFKKCMEYNADMTEIITKCFQELETREKLKDKEDREKFRKMFA